MMKTDVITKTAYDYAKCSEDAIRLINLEMVKLIEAFKNKN